MVNVFAYILSSSIFVVLGKILGAIFARYLKFVRGRKQDCIVACWSNQENCQYQQKWISSVFNSWFEHMTTSCFLKEWLTERLKKQRKEEKTIVLYKPTFYNVYVAQDWTKTSCSFKLEITSQKYEYLIWTGKIELEYLIYATWCCQKLFTSKEVSISA